MFAPMEQAALDALDRAIDAVASVGSADAGEWMVAVQQRRVRLEAVATRAVGRFDAEGDLDGAHGSVAWVAHRCRMHKARARRLVSSGRALARMPEVDAAFGRGAIDEDHVRVLAAAQSLNPELFAKAEDDLVDQACRLRFDAFARRVAYWRQDAEPDVVEDEAERGFRARRAHCSTTFGDTVVVDAVFDNVGGAIWLRELKRLEAKLFDADWRAARERLGRDPISGELDRSPEQRRLDAMVVMAQRSAAKPPGAVEPRVLLQVLVGYETFAGRVCELADGTVLTPGELVSLLGLSDVQRVVFDSPSCPIDVSARQRLFRGPTRTAVELRDLECKAHPSCDVRFPDCDVDHLQPAAWDGPTITANGNLKCRWHHRRRRGP